MKVIIVSDSHSYISTLEAIFNEEKGFDAVIHLGDGASDMSYLSGISAGKPVYQLKGNCDFNSSDLPPRFISYFAEKKTSAIMRYFCDDPARLKKGGVIEPDANDLILRMEEKPAEPFACWCAPPFYVYAKQDLHFIEEALSSGCGADAPGSFMAWLSKHAPVHAMEMPGKRYDIGNMATYEAVQREYEGIVK